MYLKSQIQGLAKQIEEAEKGIRFKIKKDGDDGLCRGLCSQTPMNFIFKKLYIKIQILKNYLYLMKFLIILQTSSLSQLTKDYNDSTLFLTIEEIKKISLMPFFVITFTCVMITR